VLAIQPPVDRMSDRPFYKQVADRLREQLDRGDIKPGEQLPSESQLMRDLAVSRATARRGLAEVINEGRAMARPGSGVFARAVDPPRRLVIHDPASNLTRFRGEGESGPMQPAAEEQGFGYRIQVLGLEQRSAPTSVAELLSVDPGTPVFVRRRRVFVRRKDRDEPFRPSKLADSFIPLDFAVGKVREEETGPGGLYARIEEQGHRLTRFDETLVFRMPRPKETRMLRLAAGVPVIDQTRVAFTHDRPVECFRAVLAGDLHEFEYRIDADATP
jgi:GntR family transcriptional regulator